MKTAIVLEVNGKQAVVLEPGGNFKIVPSKSNWRVGDSIILKEPPLIPRLLPAVACLCFAFMVIFLGINSYFFQTSLISIDINPSIELKVNRYNRVVSATALNKESKELLEQASIENKELKQAISLLFDFGLTDYFLENPCVTFAVQANSEKMEKHLIQELQTMVDTLLSSHSGKADIDLFTVDEEIVKAAHSHHISPGKYLILQELLDVMPQAEIEQYSHCSIHEIKEEIERHSCHPRFDSQLDIPFSNYFPNTQEPQPEEVIPEPQPEQPPVRQGCHNNGHHHRYR